MTTTDVYQGMNSDSKPSSRVLNPPGGGSSFSLFGGGDVEEPAHRPGRRQGNQNQHHTSGMGVFGSEDNVQQTHTGKRQGPHASSDIFGGQNHPTDYSRPNRNLNTVQGPAATTTETEQSVPKGSPAQVASQAAAQARQGTFNPITGADYPDTFGGSSLKTTPSKHDQTVNIGTASGINPITGEALIPAGPKEVHTSTRVRQPPGGASSGIF